MGSAIADPAAASKNRLRAGSWGLNDGAAMSPLVNLEDFNHRAVGYTRKYQTQHPETAQAWQDANRDRINANARQRGEKLLAWFRALKTGPCKDCGGTFPPVCMDFDHRDRSTKVADVSVLARSSKAKCLAEIAKCDLVCANCHRIRTETEHEEQRRLTRAKYTRPEVPLLRLRSIAPDIEQEICGRFEHGETQSSIARRFGPVAKYRSTVFRTLVRYGLWECPPSWARKASDASA